jgi:hypothetical protein
MDVLRIAATRNTPAILLDPAGKCFRMVGNSLPENAGEFYTPIIERLKEALPGLGNDTSFEFCLPYFNSSSLKAIYLILTEIKKAMDGGQQFEVIWHIEEDDDFMTEAAETFMEMCGIKLTLREGLIESI